LTEIAAGGGEYLNAASIPPRGLDTVIVGTGWEPNYDETAEIPCLHLQIGDEETKLKVTTKGNASALADAGVNPETMDGAIGLGLFLQVVTVTTKDKSVKKSIQIAEIVGADGKTRLYPK
jgi:hypothetical protein